MEKLGKKLKHDHTLTSILKFAIFSIVMLAPIFSVATRCLYVICNKNAKDSYSDNYVEKLTLVNTTDMLIPNSDYYVSYNANNTNVYNQRWEVNRTSVSDVIILQQNQFITYITMLNDNGTPRLNYELNDGSYGRIMNWQNTIPNFTFNLKSTTQNTFNTNFTSLYLITLQNDSLDNAFEYSLSQLEESKYYNWATNLGIYTPIYNMVNGLGGHEIIALLLAYWSIYTAIYIVFDIIIACFVKLTHLIQGE